MNITSHEIAALENRTALSRAVIVTIDDLETVTLVAAAFGGFADFCDAKGAETTAIELQALRRDLLLQRPTSNNPAMVRLTSIGIVIAASLALTGFGDFLHRNGARRQADSIATMIEQIMGAIPEDWDCGAPDCEACAKYRGRVRTGIKMAIGALLIAASLFGALAPPAHAGCVVYQVCRNNPDGSENCHMECLPNTGN